MQKTGLREELGALRVKSARLQTSRKTSRVPNSKLTRISVSVLSVLTVCAVTNSRRHDSNKRAMSARNVQAERAGGPRRAEKCVKSKRIQRKQKGSA